MCWGTEVITTVVSGATIIVVPIPNRIIPGRTSIRASPGGTRVDGRSSSSTHDAPTAGILASQSTPRPMRKDPAAMNRRGPYRDPSLPKRGEKRAMKIMAAASAIPAPAAL